MTPSKNKELIVRMSEYLPCNEIEEHSGGAARFLRFLRQDLFPFIDATYRTDSTLRIGQGHSLGGLFMLYTLFNEPDTFDRYMVSSPSLWWDDKLVLKHEEEYATSHDDLPAHVYITSGSEEYTILEGLSIIVPLLKSRNYPNLNLQYDVFNNHTHMSVIAPAFVEGLRRLLASRFG
jgi:predicted alpha/beta superfamily hydrolase